MARHKESKDIVRRERLSKVELELWPLYTQLEFADWVQDIVDGQAQYADNEEVVVYNNPTGKNSKGAVKIDGVVYANCFQASKRLGVSNSLIYKWLREGKAKRVDELALTAETDDIVINRRHFKSVEEAAKRLGVSISMINKWLELKI
jgi:transposase-like protein